MSALAKRHEGNMEDAVSAFTPLIRGFLPTKYSLATIERITRQQVLPTSDDAIEKSPMLGTASGIVGDLMNLY